MLRLVVFLGGAILMALEMVGSRVLAPSFGSSIFVWGSLISIFLAALSVGYYWGGALADRRPSLTVLSLLVAVPGALIWLLPFYFPWVNQWVVSLDLGVRLSPLVAAILLFALPSIFLGTISPYAIRLEIESVETAGNTAGRLYALSTGGSIVGTLATSFFLIPLMGVRNILHTLGLLLLALALAAYLMDRYRSGAAEPARGQRVSWRPAAKGAKGRAAAPRRRAAPAVTLFSLGFLGLGLLLTPWEGASPDLVFRKESLYHHIMVRDVGRFRILHFDNSFQSAMDLSDPDEQVFPYTRYLHLGMLFVPDAQSALFVGLGGGSAPRRFHRDYPWMTIDVAEIDPEVVGVARRFFHFEEDERLRVAARDGRLFVQDSPGGYDLAVLDAYFAESIPFHLTTQEFLSELKAKLSPRGVVVANIIGAVAGRESRLFRSMLATYQAVFPQVYVFLVGAPGSVNDRVLRNVIVIATVSDERLDRQELARRARSLWDQGRLGIDVRGYLASLVEGEIPTHDVPILTDDYAPVDSLQHF